VTAPRKGPRLVSRVHLFGFFLLVSVWIAVVGVGAAFGGIKPRREMPRRMLQHLAADFAPLVERPEELAAALSATSADLLTALSIHDASGAVVASGDGAARAVDPSLLPSDGRDVTVLEEPRGIIVTVPGVEGLYLVGLRPAYDVPIERPLAIFAAVLAVLALVSIPFARSIARPLERLTATAEELGRGKLSVRSGLRRKDEVGRLALAFDEMAGRLEALLRSEKELLANVSHELRTPLARIRVAVELAEEGDLEQARGYLREIGADLLELDRLIEDVLTAARLDVGITSGGAPPVRLVELDPAAVVERSAARFRKENPERELRVEVDPALPAVRADEVLLRRVLDNLVDNARKYSDGAIVLGARADGDAVELWVEDGGIGVEPADLERLFEPFFRTDRSRARRSGGLGLGLTLARRIVEAHGGTLVARSEPGRGSTFTVRIPASEEPAPSHRTALPFPR